MSIVTLRTEGVIAFKFYLNGCVPCFLEFTKYERSLKKVQETRIGTLIKTEKRGSNQNKIVSY